MLIKRKSFPEQELGDAMSNVDISEKSNFTTPLIFPTYIGPKIRSCTTPLLYFGELCVSLPGFLDPDTLETFAKVGAYAESTGDNLTSALRTVYHFFDLAQIQGKRTIDYIKPLSQVKRILTAYPGTEEHYEDWGPLHERCLLVAKNSLTDPQLMCTAAMEFIWRIWELKLAYDAGPKEILEKLNARAESLGGVENLLAECALNRYTIAHRSNKLNFVTTSDTSENILSLIGSEFDQGLDTKDVRAEGLAYTIFYELLTPHVPTLDGQNIQAIQTLLQSNSSELERMRRKCRQEARKLIHDAPTKEALTDAFEDCLSSMREEIAEIAQLDNKQLHNCLANIAEDPTTLATISGLVGSVIGSAPTAVTTSLAVTALSLMGAAAFKERRKRQELLATSPCSFVYWARKSKEVR